jgi:hypothetical protein
MIIINKKKAYDGVKGGGRLGLSRSRVGDGGTAACVLCSNASHQPIRHQGAASTSTHKGDIAVICGGVATCSLAKFKIALRTGVGLLFVRPVEEAGTAEASPASTADRCAATELTGYSRTRAIERRGDPIK